jgi:hypothetical protein
VNGTRNKTSSGLASQGEKKMTNYTICTDAFEVEVEADSLDIAINEAFRGELLGVTDEDSLREEFAELKEDGGWCWIEEDGERVLEINC